MKTVHDGEQSTSGADAVTERTADMPSDGTHLVNCATGIPSHHPGASMLTRCENCRRRLDPASSYCPGCGQPCPPIALPRSRVRDAVGGAILGVLVILNVFVYRGYLSDVAWLRSEMERSSAIAKRQAEQRQETHDDLMQFRRR